MLQVPIALLAFAIVFFALHLPTNPHKNQSNILSKLRRIDFLGAITLVCGVFALLLGIDRGGNISWQSPLTITFLSFAFALLSLFGFIEARIAAEPFAPGRVLAHPSLLAAYLCNFFCIASSMSVIFHTTLYLQAAAGTTASRAGLVLIPAVLGGVAGSLGSGLIMQKTGKYYWLTVVAYMGQLVGTVMLAGATYLDGGVFGLIEAGLVVQALGNGERTSDQS